jgi:hypothetical protein
VLFGLLLLANTAFAADALCPKPSSGNGQVQAVIAAVQTLKKALSPEQRAVLERPLVRESAIRWSNLPIGITPRAGLRLGDLDEKQDYAARRVAAAALSACGLKVLDEIRIADNLLKGVDARKIGWDGGNYFMSILGAPSERKPWMLQITGHHIAYNFTFNGGREGATPLFFGSEPIYFNMGDTDYEPLVTQSGAMSNLARALTDHPEAKLSGTFTDVVKGVAVEMVERPIAAFPTARWRPRNRRWCAPPSKATPHYRERPSRNRWSRPMSRRQRSPTPTSAIRASLI